MAGSISFCSHRENLPGVEENARVVIFAETQLNWMVAAFATWCLKGQARMLGMTPGWLHDWAPVQELERGKWWWDFGIPPCSDNPKQWWLVVLYTANIIYPIRSPWYPINSQFSKDHSSFWGIFSAYHRQLTLQVVTIYATLGPLDVRQEGISTNG